MKSSKTPLWKKSCLWDLSFYQISEYLDEIGENGDPYGYADGSADGYYLEFKPEFDELSAGAYDLQKQLENLSVFSDTWNDMTVGLLGDLYTVYGFDSAELDYFKLNSGFEEDLAIREAVKRLERLTKAELISGFRQVLMGPVMFFDLKSVHDCLTSIVEILDEKGAILEQKNERLNSLYKDIANGAEKSLELFENELKNIPSRMWAE